MILKDNEGNILMDGAQVLKDSEKTGTIVKVGGQAQTEVGFTSDPQQQITANKSALDTKLDKTQCTLDFNQLFDSNKSTLPSGSGLVITNIYGGHHVEGTTTSQFYHKMYSVDTIVGHQYYFAANFSEKANVYIVAKAGSTSFNTKDEKIFTGDTNFNITLQVERDKVINTDLKPILVDLTRMFGIGKEPQTTQEVQEYLVKGTYYPYDDKPNVDEVRAEVNSLSMCPSKTVDYDVMPNIKNQVSSAFTAPTNGYIYVNIGNNTNGLDISFSVSSGNYTFRKLTSDIIRDFIIFPVQKGEIIYEICDGFNNLYALTSVDFIHAKEL